MTDHASAPDDLRWMQAARGQAEEAADGGEVPVGAVVVSAENTELAAAGNRTLRDADPTAHAEIVALRRAAVAAGNHRLPGATLYATLEPCIMCVGAMVQARIARVVFGCADPKAGALGSVYPVAAHARLNHRFAVTGGVDEEACREMLKAFFRTRRS